MKMLTRAGLALSAFFACAMPAAAQTASSAAAPAGFAPMQSPCVVQVDGTCIAVDIAHPLPVALPGGGGGSSGPAVTQGSNTAGQSGYLEMCAVVSGDQAFTIGTTQPCTMTPTGRVKVGLSSATSIAPGVQSVSTLASDLVGCTYRTPVTWTLGWNGALQCDVNGWIGMTLQNSVPAGSNVIGGVTIADGASAALGAKGDAKSIATETTPASSIALLKGLIDRAQALLNALGTPYQGGGALPLPTGASTSAKQDTMIANQTATGASAQNVQGSLANLSTSLTNPFVIAARYMTTPPTYTTGQLGELQMDSRGNLGFVMRDPNSTTGARVLGPGANAATQVGLVTYSQNMVYNGGSSTWYQMPGDVNGIWIHGFPQATITDGSGSVTTGGTSQQIYAAASGRQYLMCQNPITATETLFINIGASASTTAANSYELAPGGSLTFSGAGMIPTGTVNVTAATTAHKFICKQG